MEVKPFCHGAIPLHPVMDDQWSQVDDGKPQEAGNAGVRQEQARQVRVSTKKKMKFL